MQDEIGPKLNRLREIIDEREGLAEADKRLSAEKAEIERDLLDYSERAGLDKFGNDQLSISVTEAMRAQYDPEKWPEIVAWAVANDHHEIIQRRLTDARIEALVLEGVVLPDGLSVVPIPKLSARRK